MIEIGVVLGVAVDGGLAVAVAAQQALLGLAPQRPADELGGAASGGQIPRRGGAPGEHAGGARERGDHQAVPRGQDLVVEVRPRPALAHGKQLRARAAERVDDGFRRLAGSSRDVVDRLRDIEEVPARELALRILRRVAVRLDAEPPPHDRRIVARHGADLGVGPDVERAFGLVRRRIAGLLGRHAVGVLSRVEAAVADRSGRASRRPACLPRPSRRSRLPSPARPRGTRA